MAATKSENLIPFEQLVFARQFQSFPYTPKLKPDDSEQSKRFIETAKEVGADEDTKALEHAFKKIISETTKDRKDRA